MTYKKQFVAVIKANGKILREVDDKDGETVHLPYGSEYSIFLKNLEARTALVKISIDGTSVGKDFVISGNSELELERFVENLNEGNKFKFIQKTQQIAQHRGDKIDDGIVRIEFTFEKNKPVFVDVQRYYYDWWYYHPIVWSHPYPHFPYIRYNSLEQQNINACSTEEQGAKIGFNAQQQTLSSSKVRAASFLSNAPMPAPDEGITVKGSPSNQQFRYGSIGELEPNSYVITLRLKGYSSKGNVVTAVTTKTKLGCPTCGRKNRSSVKYCSNCGTFLY